MPNFSIIAKPLTDFKKKNQKFEINEQQISVFSRLKVVNCQQLVLKYCNPRYETEVHTNVSIEDMAPYCFRNHQMIIAYTRSITLAGKQLIKGVMMSYEPEILAVIASLKKF